MPTLADRVKQRIADLGIEQVDVAKAVGATPTTIYKIVDGQTKSSRFLPKIAEYLRVSEQWLLFGDESNAMKMDAQIDEWDDSTPIPEDMVAIPFLNGNSLSAGAGALNSDIPYTGAKLWYARSFLRRKNATPESVFCITVTGKSMEPVFSEGGMVMVNTLERDIINEKPYAITYKGCDYIKFLIKSPNGEITAISANPDYAPFICDIDDLQIIGRVIEYSKAW